MSDNRNSVRALFCADVDRRIRKSMTNYLRGHFRYFTMNSWNGLTSYAHNVKVHRLPVHDGAYEMLESDEWHSRKLRMMRAFDRAHEHVWQVGTNGRSGGYIVLYQGGVKDGRVYTASRGIDTDDDFDSWSMDALRDRVKLVQEFDELVFDIVSEFIRYCDRFELHSVSEFVEVARERKVLVARSER